MGDLGEYYKDLRDFSREKRWDNYDSNKEKITVSGIKFEEKANGHLILDTKHGKVDFWATTNKFFIRTKNKRGQGLDYLLNFLK